MKKSKTPSFFQISCAHSGLSMLPSKGRFLLDNGGAGVQVNLTLASGVSAE